MIGVGRPLRFLVLVLGLWIGVRTWQLSPDTPLPSPVREAARRVIERTLPVVAPKPSTVVEGPRRSPGGVRATNRSQARVSAPVTPAPMRTGPGSALVQLQPRGRLPIEGTQEHAAGLSSMTEYGAPEPSRPTGRRWSASGWAIVRGAGQGGGVATPQLGGAQAGVRIARALDTRGRLAIAGRFAAALGTRQQEAALGLEWRPTELPIRAVAERRIGLANQRGGTALGLVGGIGDRPLPAGFRLDGYAQAGAVLRDRIDGYVDGAIRIVRPAFRTTGGTVLSLGLGAWGAAQRDAERLDAGPTATLELPIGDAPRLRISLEWRQRVAGEASPGSGPALSIGTDY